MEDEIIKGIIIKRNKRIVAKDWISNEYSIKNKILNQYYNTIRNYIIYIPLRLISFTFHCLTLHYHKIHSNVLENELASQAQIDNQNI